MTPKISDEARLTMGMSARVLTAAGISEATTD
jgi:hypothetical protein